MNRAIFLDRDGVINDMVPSEEGPDSPRSANEFRLLPGVATAVRDLNSLGLPVVVISNQPGVAKGKFQPANLDAITQQMKADLMKELAVLHAVYYCMHHPDAAVLAYRSDCDCRKPKAGLLTQASHDMKLLLAGSYMVGDHARDMIAGKSVGCTTIFVASDTPIAVKPNEADHICEDLVAATRLICQLEGAAWQAPNLED